MSLFFVGKVRFLVIILVIALTSCLQIESKKEKGTQFQNFIPDNPSAIRPSDSKYNYGSPSQSESKKTNTLKSRYDENPDSLSFGVEYGKHLAEIKQFGSATKVFEGITYANPGNIIYNRLLGQCYLLTDKVSKAIFHLNKAAIAMNDSVHITDDLNIRSTKPKYNYHSLQFNVWYLLGNAYFNSKNYDKAITCFKNSLRHSDVLNLKVISTNFLYMAYGRAGNKSLAAETLQTIANVKSIRSARVHLKSLKIYQGKSDPNKIAMGVKKRYFKEDDFSILLYCIGNYHIINKDYAAARMVLSRAIEEGRPYTLGHILASSDMKIIEENLLTH